MPSRKHRFNISDLLSLESPRRIAQAGAAIMILLGMFLLALNRRRIDPTLAAILPDALTDFDLDPYWVGLILQVTIFPMALIYLFSQTQIFQRVVDRQLLPYDEYRFLGGLLGIQTLTHAYEWWLYRMFHEPLLFSSSVVVITGSLLGGWRTGLWLSLARWLFFGSCDLLLGWGPEFRFLYQSGGLLILLQNPPWVEILGWFYVGNMRNSSVLGVGAIASLCADLLGKQRSISPMAPLLGATAEMVYGYLTLIAGEPPGLMALMPSMLISALAMVVVTLIVSRVQAKAARRRAELAELARARAEVRALRAQINPHFLFNALNTIRYFVRTDPGIARCLLLDLSEVFQRALRSGEFVALQDEISYVEAYLALEKARLEERLRIVWAIPDDLPLDQPVPTLILQPIVENAVVHGVSKQPEGGTVRITIEPTNGELLLRVEDDGPGLPAERLTETLVRPPTSAQEENSSIGLRNVDGRLNALYGPEHRLTVSSKLGQGTRVEIRIPKKA